MQFHSLYVDDKLTGGFPTGNYLMIDLVALSAVRSMEDVFAVDAGVTDIGAVSARVSKGQILRLRIPSGTRGSQVEAFCRSVMDRSEELTADLTITSDGWVRYAGDEDRQNVVLLAEELREELAEMAATDAVAVWDIGETEDPRDLVKFVQEHSPNIDLSDYDAVLAAIEALYDDSDPSRVWVGHGRAAYQVVDAQ